ncbi:MAG TPA: HAMP domain-containing sensor histidine kinase, partial [Elusimicrobiota bacterium]|nr:HAMP domain-containing sensor histidine kinase [Elusimicrobiota bacterium]
SSILPCLDTLVQGDLGTMTPEQIRFVQMARRAGQEMLMLIQNLLDVAKMEEGKMTLHPEPFLPLDWAHSVIQSFRPLAEASRKRLSLFVAETLPTASGDIGLLSRVLGNLISNALRHTQPDAGEVIVSVFQDGNQLAVEVRDNGEGIPAEDQQRIFEKFVQADGQRTRVRFGSGLGLTFCKMVMDAHGGRISVFSVPNEGSLFTVHLPLPVSEQAVAPAIAEPLPS